MTPLPDLELVSASYHVVYPDQTIDVDMNERHIVEPLICPSDVRRVRLVLRYNRKLDESGSGKMFEGNGFCGCIGIVGKSEFVNVRDFVPGMFEWRARTGERFAIFFVPGDVNGDGHVNVIDTSAAASHGGKLIGAQTWRADVNGDGKLNVIDTAAVARRVGS